MSCLPSTKDNVHASELCHKKDASTKLWHDVGDAKAHEKFSQAFREKKWGKQAANSDQTDLQQQTIAKQQLAIRHQPNSSQLDRSRAYQQDIFLQQQQPNKRKWEQQEHDARQAGKAQKDHVAKAKQF